MQGNVQLLARASLVEYRTMEEKSADLAVVHIIHINKGVDVRNCGTYLR